MNGGGNDVLQGNIGACREFNRSCQRAIEGALAQGEELFKTMEADGVKDVVYLGYYYTKGLIAGGLDEALDYAMVKISELCEDSMYINCVVVDPRSAFKGRTGLITLDGIHPSTRGSNILADLIWEKMIDYDIEQQ